MNQLYKVKSKTGHAPKIKLRHLQLRQDNTDATSGAVATTLLEFTGT
ncbi:MAG TPA: hypothetical protein VIJ01_00510 [Candidatus Angelobacter sp.]